MLNPPFTRTAVDITGTGKVVFAGFEQRQDIVPGPTGVALLGPPVVVTGLATHVDHAVDRGTAAEHLAPWITQGTPVEARLGFGLEAPVGTWVTDAIQVTHRNMNPRIVVFTARFEQQYPTAWVGRQTIGQQASGRTGTDDHVIVDRIG
ncbi:hypothetical protein D3C79_853080 [compost metagenome]